MKKIKYIFFFITLLLFNNNVYANNYVVLNTQDIKAIENVLNNNENITINLNYNNKLITKRKVLDLIKVNNKTITYNILK